MPLREDLRIIFIVVWMSHFFFVDTLSGVDFNGSLALGDGADGIDSGWVGGATTLGRLKRGLGKRRPRRYAAFPEGSSFTCAVCATVGVVGSPSYTYLSYGLNWGMAYDLPNETWILNHLHGFSSRPEPVSIIRRRNRRRLYKSIENVADSMGYNGRDCILRALCESSSFFQSDKLGMVPELVRTIFSLPKTRLYARELREDPDIEHYNRAYFAGEDEDCEMKYPCSFSLLELAMGRYSDPPEYYDDQEMPGN